MTLFLLLCKKRRLSIERISSPYNCEIKNLLCSARMLDLSLCISPINVDCRQTTIYTKTILSVLEALINVFLIQIFRYLFGRNDDLFCCLIVYFLYRNSILLHNSLISHSLNSPLIFLNRHFNRNNGSLSICFFN